MLIFWTVTVYRSNINRAVGLNWLFQTSGFGTQVNSRVNLYTRQQILVLLSQYWISNVAWQYLDIRRLKWQTKTEMYLVVCAVYVYNVYNYLVARDDSSPKCCVNKTLSCSSTQLLMKVSKSCSWWDAVSLYHEINRHVSFMLSA